MFRQIAIKYSQEVDELAQAYDQLYETVEQDRATYQDTIDELEQKQNRDAERLKKLQTEISQLRTTAPTTPAPRPSATTPRSARVPILPFTPKRRTQRPPSLEDYTFEDGPTSRFLPATPLVAQASRSLGSKKHSVKFPDPPMLKDGREVRFEQWKDLLEDKLRANSDWYQGSTTQDT